MEDRRKGSNIAWTRTILRNSCTFEPAKDIREVQSILHCKTMYCYQKMRSATGKNSNTADYRVPGTSISTVKLQDARRQNNVTKLVEMFEKL